VERFFAPLTFSKTPLSKNPLSPHCPTRRVYPHYFPTPPSLSTTSWQTFHSFLLNDPQLHFSMPSLYSHGGTVLYLARPSGDSPFFSVVAPSYCHLFCTCLLPYPFFKSNQNVIRAGVPSPPSLLDILCVLCSLTSSYGSYDRNIVLPILNAPFPEYDSCTGHTQNGKSKPPFPLCAAIPFPVRKFHLNPDRETLSPCVLSPPNVPFF